MFVIYGFYRFGQKRVGYRNDFCLTCKSESLAEQWRSFNCGHLFFVPLIPFGFVNRWLCPTCKLNPHYPPSSKGYKVLVTTLVGIITALILFVTIYSLVVPRSPDSPRRTPADDVPIWIMAIIFSGIFAFCVRWTRKHTVPLDLTEQLRQVKPARLDVCPYCDQRLNDEGFCGACQLKRYDVNDLRR